MIVEGMPHLAPWLIAALLSLAPLTSAKALCVYRGDLYARTTSDQEFADARWVVKARVLSAINGGGTGDVEPWTLYRLEILTTFKGALPERFTLFTERNSGGFYLDRAGGRPDVGADYLLFLNPLDRSAGAPEAARGAVKVNYSCGRSRPWAEVGAAEIQLLETLAGRAATAPRAGASR